VTVGADFDGTGGDAYGIVEFSGSSAQSVSGASGLLPHVKISSSDTVSLGSNIKIEGDLTIASGELDTTSAYTLEITGVLHAVINGCKSG